MEPSRTKSQKFQELLRKIKTKLTLGLPLSNKEAELAHYIEKIDRLGYSVKEVFEDGKLHIVRKMTVDPMFDHVKLLSQTAKPKSGKYVGSIDPMTAAEFVKQTGAGVGTAEFNEYAFKRIESDLTKYGAKYYDV